MTIAIKSNIVLSALAVFLGLAVASPAAWAFADQTDSQTYDIDKEDAELGDYSGWNSHADRKAPGPGTISAGPSALAGPPAAASAGPPAAAKATREPRPMPGRPHRSARPTHRIRGTANNPSAGRDGG